MTAARVSNLKPARNRLLSSSSTVESQYEWLASQAAPIRIRFLTLRGHFETEVCHPHMVDVDWHSNSKSRWLRLRGAG